LSISEDMSFLNLKVYIIQGAVEEVSKIQKVSMTGTWPTNVVFHVSTRWHEENLEPEDEKKSYSYSCCPTSSGLSIKTASNKARVETDTWIHFKSFLTNSASFPFYDLPLLCKHSNSIKSKEGVRIYFFRSLNLIFDKAKLKRYSFGLKNSNKI